MNLYAFLFCTILLQLTIALAGIANISDRSNLTAFLQQRQKRSLIYQNGGTIKLVIGPTLPVNLGDPIVWRSLICSYNLQGGHYGLPTEPLYPWDKWENTFARSMRRPTEQVVSDDSRLFVYTALEKFMSRQSGNGRACLLRAICENAQIDQHVGIFAEILDIVLTPGEELLDVAYKEAHQAGLSGADCYKLYLECPAGANLLDQYLDYL